MSDIINEIRNKLDMDNPKDVEAWDTVMDIQNTTKEELIKGMVDDVRAELQEIESQIETMEKIRIRYLYSSNNLSRQASDSLKILKEQMNELSKTLQSEAYKGVGGGLGSRTVETRKRS